MPEAAGLPPDALAAQFASFGEEGRVNGSSLYEQLALAVAGDSDLLALAAHGRNRPVPNLFFAAVHYLILKGTAHPLAALYRAAAEGTRAGRSISLLPLVLQGARRRDLQLARDPPRADERRATLRVPCPSVRARGSAGRRAASCAR